MSGSEHRHSVDSADSADSSDSSDSAGIPFGGRELSGTGFDGDTGEIDAVLRDALADPGAERELMRAVADARLLVPIVAEPTEVDDTGALAVEKSTDLAAVTLVAPDGARALPVFTSTDSLAAWDPQARPVPVTAGRAAQAAVSERCDVMVLDVSGPRTVALRPSMVWALAQQRDWVPAHEDPLVYRAVEDAVHEQPEVLGFELGAGEPGQGVLRVALRLRPGLDAAQVQAVATAVGSRLATDGEIRARIDGIAFAIS